MDGSADAHAGNMRAMQTRGARARVRGAKAGARMWNARPVPAHCRRQVARDKCVVCRILFSFLFFFRWFSARVVPLSCVPVSVSVSVFTVRVFSRPSVRVVVRSPPAALLPFSSRVSCARHWWTCRGRVWCRCIGRCGCACRGRRVVWTCGACGNQGWIWPAGREAPPLVGLRVVPPCRVPWSPFCFHAAPGGAGGRRRRPRAATPYLGLRFLWHSAAHCREGLRCRCRAWVLCVAAALAGGTVFLWQCTVFLWQCTVFLWQWCSIGCLRRRLSITTYYYLLLSITIYYYAHSSSLAAPRFGEWSRTQ